MLEVLSRPTILVENNEEANITIGDRVPFVTSSAVSDSGQINSQVQYEDVGIILNVVPHINPDGYVNLEVEPEISALNPAGSGVQISEGLTAPTFSLGPPPVSRWPRSIRRVWVRRCTLATRPRSLLRILVLRNWAGTVCVSSIGQWQDWQD